jgi:hypothetical protein
MAKLNTTTSGIITSVLTADSSPALELQENGVTIGKFGNQPAFSAYQSTAQTLSSATFTKLSCQTEEFDTNSNFDNSTYRFTPTVAGYYYCTAAFAVGVSASSLLVTFYKNGSEFKRVTYQTPTGGTNQCSGSALIYCNGSTDYIEAYVYIATGQVLNASSTQTYFQGFMVRAA